MAPRLSPASPPPGTKTGYFSAGGPLQVPLGRFGSPLAPFCSLLAPFQLHFGPFWLHFSSKSCKNLVFWHPRSRGTCRLPHASPTQENRRARILPFPRPGAGLLPQATEIRSGPEAPGVLGFVIGSRSTLHCTYLSTSPSQHSTFSACHPLSRQVICWLVFFLRPYCLFSFFEGNLPEGRLLRLAPSRPKKT